MPHKHFTFSSPPFPKQASKPLSPAVRRGVPSSGTLLPDTLGSCCAYVTQPQSLPALSAQDGMLWRGAVVCPLQPPAGLCRSLERCGGAGLPGIIGLLVAAALVLAAAIHVGTLLQSCRDGRKPLFCAERESCFAWVGSPLDTVPSLEWSERWWARSSSG